MKEQVESVQSLRSRIQELGTEVRSALAAVLTQIGGPGVRPVTLAKALKVDDTFAARLVRAVRADDPLSVLREVPAPHGLRQFVDASAKAGVRAEAREAAAAAVARFEELLNELPFGRTSLDTAIDGWLPSGRTRAERAGKQMVFKVLSQTLGYTIDTVCRATAIQPSASGERCDTLSFLAMDGIRRSREGAPILVFGTTKLPLAPADEGRGHAERQQIESLDGEHEVTDARKYVLPEVGQGAELPLRVLERGTHTRIVMDSSMPPLNVPVTTAVAYVTRNDFLRYRTAERGTDALMSGHKVPIRTLVEDLFIHEDVYQNFEPHVVTRIDNMSFDPSERDAEMLEIDRLEMDVEVARLGWGLGRVGVKEWGGYAPAIRGAFERAGWDASKFRAYRFTVRYPLPFVTFTTWFDLPVRG